MSVSLFKWGQGWWSLYDITSCLADWSHVPSVGLCPWSHVPSRGICPRGLCLGGLCPGSLCLKGLCQGVFVQGDLSPGVSVQGRSLPKGSLSEGVSVQGVAVQGGVSIRRLLPQSKKQVVRILLEFGGGGVVLATHTMVQFLEGGTHTTVL